MIEPEFMMTLDEVKYFLENIEHEYINKDRYYEVSNLIKRMREFVADNDELVRKSSQST